MVNHASLVMGGSNRIGLKAFLNGFTSGLFSKNGKKVAMLPSLWVSSYRPIATAIYPQIERVEHDVD